MMGQQCRVRLGQFIRDADRFSLIVSECLLKRDLRKESLDLFAQHDAKLLVQRNKPRVKRGVMDSRQT